MNAYLINRQPSYESVKRDGRARFRGKRKGRNLPRHRVIRGQARARWAVDTPLGPILGRTRAEAIRRAGLATRWHTKHSFKLPS